MPPGEGCLEPPPRSYRLVLPPGWERIPLRFGTEPAVRAVLDRSFAGLPRDRVAHFRKGLEDRLWRQIRAARENSGLDLYLPVDAIHGNIVAVSVLVAEMSFPGDPAGEQAPPPEVMAVLAAGDAAARVVGIGDTPAVRTERVAAAKTTAAPAAAGHDAAVVRSGDDETGPPEERVLRESDRSIPASRRVDYVFAVPRDPQRWLTVCFSTLGDGDPTGAFTDLLVELFDAMMTTFRWVR